jgi:hypothetical protein
MRCCFIFMVLFVVSAVVNQGTAAQVSVERTDQGAVVKVDGQLFTEYLVKSETKPILWPILGPSGKAMTRQYPMREVKEEVKKDHPHQRSLWFTHGKVNNIDFWSEKPTGKTGIIEHLEFVQVDSGDPAVIVTRNAWLTPERKKVCEDQRTLRFGADGAARWIDFDITLKATEGPVTFGPTKEGAFGLRIAESMNVDSKLGGKIVNSDNIVDADAWAKRASWVDYHGPVDGETVGVAIFNHPTSFRYPTYWHVRTYGLFAANPFGEHDFVKDSPADAGQFILPANESITLRYRVFFHRGDEKEGKVAEAFEKYAKEK